MASRSTELKEIKTRAQIQIEQQFLFTLAQIIEVFPQYTIGQHIAHFTRKKNELKTVYFWSDEVLLSKLEAYYDELKNDLSTSTDDDDE